MKKWNLRRTHFWWVVGVVIAMGVGSISLFLPDYLSEKIAERITEAGVTFSSINVHLLSRSVKIEDPCWVSAQDSSHQSDMVALKSVQLKGIHLFNLIFADQLTTNEVVIDSGRIAFRLRKGATVLPKKKTAFTDFHFKAIAFRNLFVEVIQNKSVVLSTHLSAELSVLKIRVDPPFESVLQIGAARTDLSQIAIFPEGGMYGATVGRITFDSRNEILQLDSGLLIPLYEKLDFGRRAGTETARINLSVPSIKLEGLSFQQLLRKELIVRKITIPSFDLFVFKDKRIPFLKTDHQPLPMESLSKVPYAIQVDSVLIGDSEIKVEQILKGSVASGTVQLEQVRANIAGLNNRVGNPKDSKAVLKASAKLMGEGAIVSEFHFPTDGSGIYSANGSISNMDFKRLNPVLENMADLQVQSGFLDKLTYQFTYTDMSSHGTLDIIYQNLRIAGLDRNKKTKNGLKTMVLRLVMKRDQAKETSSSNRGGIIDVERDRRRFVFNLWLKSLADGLKSSMIGRPPKRPDTKQTTAVK
jgi:hypothetical protein